MSIFKEEAHKVWMEHSSVAKKSIYALTNSEDIETARKHFVTLSNQMVMLAKIFDPTERTLYIQHCPMANQDNGADWLSTEKEIKNPYFGASMLKCGEVKEELK
jgi:Cu(I)/Ag(I) efflux system membrane fusion protein